MKILAALLCSTLVLGIVGFLLFGPWPHRAQERDDVYRRTSESAEGDTQKQRAGTPLPAPKESLPGRLAASLMGRAHRPNGTPLENMGISLFRVEEVDEITLEEAGGNGPSGLQRLFENHVELKGQARSNARGEFSFSELEPGVYAAVASGPSFLSQVSDVLPLTMGETRQVDLALEAGRSITGRVVSSDGEPVEGAEIEASLESLPFLPRSALDLIRFEEASLPRRVKSADGGSFRVEGLFQGSYQVTAMASDHAPESVAGVRAEEKDLVLVLQQGAVVEGRVAFEDGKPASGANLSLLPREWEGHSPQARADGDGNFRLGGVQPGLYSVRASGKGMEVAHVEAFRVVESARNSLEIRARPGHILAGKAIDPEGKGIAGLQMTLEGGSGPERHAVPLETGRDGSFFADTLHPLKYALSIAAKPLYAEQLIEALEPDQKDLLIQISPGSRFSGKVSDAENGRAVAQARLFVRRLSRDLRGMEARTGGDGVFTLWAPAGEPLQVEVRASGYLLAHSDLFSLDPGAALEDLQIRVSRAGALQGVVKTRAGEPLEGGTVSFTSEEVDGEIRLGSWGGPVSTGPDGSFRLSLGKTRAGGTYRLLAQHPRYFLPEDIRITVENPSKDLNGIELVVAPGSRVSGTVMDRSRAPLSRALVQVLGLPGDAPMPGKGAPGGGAFWLSLGQRRTDLLGRFEMAGLKPGYVMLRVKAPGFADYASEAFQLPEGENLAKDIVLEEELVIAGKTLDPLGRPLTGVRVTADLPSGLGKNPSEAFSDQNGDYRLTALGVGLFDLRAKKAGYASQVLSQVKAGESAADFALEPLGAVSGKVFDQRTGSPLRAFQLRLLPDSRDFQVHDGAGTQAFESEGGTFLQDGIPPGPYRLVISSPGYVPSESLITVEAGGVARKEVALDPGEEIKGVVLDSRESPVPGAKVMAVLSATPVPNPEIPSEAPEAVASDPSTWSQKTGEFRISGLESGVYRIVVHHKDYLVYVSGEVSLSSTTGSLPPEVRVALSDGARVTGALRNPNGMPIPGGEVELRGPKLRKAALADKEGRFIFRGVPPGEYFLGRSGDPGGAKKQVSVEVRPEDTEVSQDLPGDK